MVGGVLLFIALVAMAVLLMLGDRKPDSDREKPGDRPGELW